LSISEMGHFLNRTLWFNQHEIDGYWVVFFILLIIITVS